MSSCVTSPDADAAYMVAALSLGARNLGDTWPNPAVGCVIVKNNLIVGRGWTQTGGRPHAEMEALSRAGENAKGATAYVTLEPCSHHGKTPPCAEALIAAGIARVVVGAGDPDPRVAGQGIAKLKAAGVQVDVGEGKAAAERTNAGFFLRFTENRPLFALKTASSLDGRIALANGDSKWITGPAARQAVQAVRARYDAILIGSGTALADDPALTCRLDGYTGRPKVRIVLDRRLRLPLTSQLVKTACNIPTWVVTSEVSPKAKALAERGVDVITARAENFNAVLAERGLTRILIEGGGQVAGAFLKAHMIDEVVWFRSGSVIGGDGLPSVGDLQGTYMAASPHFKHVESLVFGADTLDMLTRKS
jgi:diaminohydroxyphosphoribosylaminopyrimidine deaminase / 5-amino-6-(5-phosphoribosylamino)uracil reductase